MVPAFCLCYTHTQRTASSACLQVEDDLFVMPTIPEDGSIYHERRQRDRAAAIEPLPLTIPERHVVGLPTGLELQDTMLM